MVLDPKAAVDSIPQAKHVSKTGFRPVRSDSIPQKYTNREVRKERVMQGLSRAEVRVISLP